MNLRHGLVWVMVSIVPPSEALAENSSSYRRDMEAANRRVQNQNILNITTQNVSRAQFNGQLPDVRYTTGQLWTIAVAMPNINIMLAQTLDETYSVSLFHFRVVAVDSSVATIEVTRQGSSAKSTLSLDRRGHALAARGVVGTCGMALFPMSVPSLEESIQSHPRGLPKLPRELAAYSAGQQGVQPDQSTEFEAQDLLSRTTKVIWNKGDPWPAYIWSPAGVSILLKPDNYSGNYND